MRKVRRVLELARGRIRHALGRPDPRSLAAARLHVDPDSGQGALVTRRISGAYVQTQAGPRAYRPTPAQLAAVLELPPDDGPAPGRIHRIELEPDELAAIERQAADPDLEH